MTNMHLHYVNSTILNLVFYIYTKNNKCSMKSLNTTWPRMNTMNLFVPVINMGIHLLLHLPLFILPHSFPLPLRFFNIFLFHCPFSSSFINTRHCILVRYPSLHPFPSYFPLIFNL